MSKLTLKYNFIISILPFGLYNLNIRFTLIIYRIAYAIELLYALLSFLQILLIFLKFSKVLFKKTFLPFYIFVKTML